MKNKVITIAPLKKEGEKLRVAAYCRVSTDSNDQLNSFYAQVRYYTDYIKLNDNMKLVDIYADEGFTGTSIEKRPEFKRLIEDVKLKKLDRVLVKSVTRFARNALECIETVRLFKGNGVSVYFENDNIDTELMNSEMILYIKSAFAQGEALSASRRMAVSARARMADGTYHLSNAPYGYRLQDGSLVVVPQEAEHVKIIYRLYLSGMGEHVIAEYMNEHYPDRRWSKGTINLILTNERYIGDCLLQKSYSPMTLPLRKMKNNGELPKYYYTGTHEPIVCAEDYQKAQKLRLRRQDMYCREDRRSAENEFFFGKVYCRHCGWLYKRREREELTYWYCSKKGNTEEKCHAPGISDHDLREMFIHVFHRLKQNEKIVVHDTLLQLQALKLKQNGSSTELCEIDREIAALSDRNKIYAELFTQGILDEITYYGQTDRLKNKITELRSRRMKLLCVEAGEESIEQMRKLEKLLLNTEYLSQFDEGLFDEIVEKVYMEQNGTVTFSLKCGLELNIAWEEL